MVFVWKYTNPAATFLLRHAAESHHHVYCVLFKTSLLLSAGYCTSSKIVALFWVIWGKNSNKSLWSSDRRRTCWSFGKARGVEKKTPLVSSLSSNKTSDPINRTTTWQTGFRRSHPKQPHRPPPHMSPTTTTPAAAMPTSKHCFMKPAFVCQCVSGDPLTLATR